MDGFKVSNDLTLPEDAALWTFADLAIKGAGKTYAACVLAEEMVEHEVPIIALDGIGIWWGLRVGVHGHKGLPIVVFGGQHKDLPIPATFGRGRNLVVDEPKLQLMVKAILEAGISAVVDTSEFSKGMQRRIVGVFVNELYHLNSKYGTRHVFIEEADLWIPQRIVGDVAFCAGAIDDLVRRGGNFNLGCTLISQRHAVVNKDVVTQAGCLVILRTVHDLDKKAVKAWVENVAHPNDPKLQKWYDGLRDLKDGEAWVWHPTEPVIFKKIHFRERHTLHATREFFRTPEAKRGEKVDVSEFIERFKKIFEPPKPKETPKPLERREAPSIIPGQRALTLQEVEREHPPYQLPPVPISRPQLNIHQSEPILSTLDEPTTPLGRVCVVLKNYTGRQDKWSTKKIKAEMKNHAWDEQGVDEAIEQLVRWEILRTQSNKLFYFYKERVQLNPQTPTLEVP